MEQTTGKGGGGGGGGRLSMAVSQILIVWINDHQYWSQISRTWFCMNAGMLCVPKRCLVTYTLTGLIHSNVDYVRLWPHDFH